MGSEADKDSEYQLYEKYGRYSDTYRIMEGYHEGTNHR